MITLLDAAAHLFLGSVCPGCRLPSCSLCASCTQLLTAPTPVVVERPGLERIPVVAANSYRPLVEHLVPAFKDDGALHLARALSGRLAAAVAELRPAPATVLVPVPSLAAKVRARGLDHGRRLVAGAARSTRLAWRPLLARAASGVDQRELGRRGRSSNVEATMRARACRAPVLLCDDVVTTGATLVEAVRAVRLAGDEVVGVAVIGDADRTRADQLTDISHPGS